MFHSDNGDTQPSHAVVYTYAHTSENNNFQHRRSNNNGIPLVSDVIDVASS